MSSQNHSQPPRKFRPGPFEYHQEIELEITSLTNMGQGVGRIDDWVVFVRFTLPGETVKARVYRNDKNFSEADLVEVLVPSPHRVDAKCQYFGECGGCQYQHFAYDEQLKWKTQQVKELLWHMVRIEQDVLPAIPSPKDYAYRSKITPHFAKPKEGIPPKLGYLKAGTRFNYVDVENCPLVSQPMNDRLAELREEVFQKADEKAYRKGATLLIREHLDGVTSDHKATIKEKVGDIVFSFTAGEFFQNNPHILPKFTEYVSDQARKAGARNLVDAYCGSGLFCLTAAKDFEKAIGIEVSEHSVKWAIQNATDNGIENASFVLGDAASIFKHIDFPGDESAVIIDPPRKGSNEEFLSQLIQFGPKSIVYVSCNPATQMRDLLTLLAGDYEIAEVQPFDLFPQTKHLECVITLNKKAPSTD